ncbi:MAG: putative acylesterase/phospholipase RssA [Candidatus Azotimanducaceae bacterium]|jgi:predicted acylesterase/phospholipase RssA
MLSLKSSHSRLDRDLSRAKSYEEWQALAMAHDEATGMDKWKLEPTSTKYDYANIQYRLDELRKLRANHDDVGLLFSLNEGIHGNQGGIGNDALYEKAKFGTKKLITDYVDEVVDALRHIESLPESDELNHEDKIDFFHRARLCFGRSALMMSGAGSLGHFHHGVGKVLIEHDMLPDVISGSSAGSIFASLLGTHTTEELTELFETDLFQSPIEDEQERHPWGLVRPQVDPDQLRVMLERFIPNMTFQEAYEKTGRSISVTIAPHEENQSSRLMNAVTSPNVYIRSAVTASCAVPGVFPPVMLMAKNVYGEPQPYLPNRRWVDGSVTDDLPAKRLSRLYAVNHYIVSQANPLSLAMLNSDRLIPLPSSTKSIMRHATREMLKSSEQFSRKYLRQIPSAGQAMSMFHSLMAQDYTGDINIVPNLGFIDPQKLLAQLSAKEIEELVTEGEKSTWPQLERIRISTKIGRTLDHILDNHTNHNIKKFYKKRTRSTKQAKT